MSLSQSTIKSQIDTLLSSTESLELQEAKDQFAEQLAAVIIAAIKSATLTIPPSAIVTVGSAATQTNAIPVIVNGGLT